MDGADERDDLAHRTQPLPPDQGRPATTRGEIPVPPATGRPMAPTDSAMLPAPPDVVRPRSAPAGWYADPHGVAALRYWDGSSWTPHVTGQPSQVGGRPPVTTTVVVNAAGVPEKNLAAAGILTFFFGPLGMLYSTVSGAVIMFLLNVVLGVVTFGLFLFVAWPIQLVWALVAAHQHNQRVRGHSAITAWKG